MGCPWYLLGMLGFLRLVSSCALVAFTATLATTQTGMCSSLILEQTLLSLTTYYDTDYIIMWLQSSPCEVGQMGREREK